MWLGKADVVVANQREALVGLMGEGPRLGGGNKAFGVDHTASGERREARVETVAPLRTYLWLPRSMPMRMLPLDGAFENAMYSSSWRRPGPGVPESPLYR